MSERETELIKMRPHIKKAKVDNDTHDSESFQNQTIRPIIKLQHGLLIQVFNRYFKKRKNAFFSLKEDKKKDYIRDILQKDHRFKSELIGMIIGHFTLDEYQTYSINISELNRRILSILQKRMIDEMGEFSRLED